MLKCACYTLQHHQLLNVNKNTLYSCKKEWPSTKKALLKYVKSNGLSRPPAFDRYISFGHDDLTVKHCYFSCLRPRPPNVDDGIKIFDKHDRAAKR